MYADEDVEARRTNLQAVVKGEFLSAMDEAGPDAGALRLEARHRFSR